MHTGIDFTNCNIDDSRYYGGANGNKIGIIYNNNTYMQNSPIALAVTL